MTIEEKRDVLQSYCDNIYSCELCILNNTKHNWAVLGHCNADQNCLLIEKSPEKDLDKALELIAYKATPNGKAILTPEQQKVCADVLAFYGYDMERMVAIEEMSELTKELSKQKRGEGNREHLIEEIADVYICLEKIEQMNNITHEELSEWITRKIDRIDKRIKSEGKI